MKTVFVVDDDPDLRALVVQLLRTKYEVREAPGGAEALAALADTPAPDLFVFDVMMPGMDGIELARAVRGVASCAKVPIVFLTTKGRFEDVVEGINAGARHYVTKPFKAADLLGKVAKILG